MKHRASTGTKKNIMSVDTSYLLQQIIAQASEVRNFSLTETAFRFSNNIARVLSGLARAIQSGTFLIPHV
jgi:hypothetical protein